MKQVKVLKKKWIKHSVKIAAAGIAQDNHEKVGDGLHLTEKEREGQQQSDELLRYSSE